jgi:hypothetical protein
VKVVRRRREIGKFGWRRGIDVGDEDVPGSSEEVFGQSKTNAYVLFVRAFISC